MVARAARDDIHPRSHFCPRQLVTGPRQLSDVTYQFRAPVDGRRVRAWLYGVTHASTNTNAHVHRDAGAGQFDRPDPGAGVGQLKRPDPHASPHSHSHAQAHAYADPAASAGRDTRAHAEAHANPHAPVSRSHRCPLVN